MSTFGVKEITCHCGKKMERLGGVFGGEITFSTYYCRPCKQAVNVYFHVKLDNKDYPTEIERN
jgi:hypothetical protein